MDDLIAMQEGRDVLAKAFATFSAMTPEERFAAKSLWKFFHAWRSAL